MKTWERPELKELDFTTTADKGGNGNGNNKTHEHKGWCQIRETGVCTCGVDDTKSDVTLPS